MIVVAKPAAGARVTSPVRVAGTANVFEANVTVQVLDSNGQVLGKTFTTATCGTGCRGSYSVPVTFKVDQEHRRLGRRRRRTGTPPHIVRIAVVLVPAP